MLKSVEELAKSFVEFAMVTLLSAVMMSSSLSQANSTMPGSMSVGTSIEQITYCFCPTVFWLKPLGCMEIFREESRFKNTIVQIKTHNFVVNSTTNFKFNLTSTKLL